jgi:hypothetical protein
LFHYPKLTRVTRKLPGIVACRTNSFGEKTLKRNPKIGAGILWKFFISVKTFFRFSLDKENLEKPQTGLAFMIFSIKFKPIQNQES